MGKDPAFLFYPGDWLGGTMGMDLEMKGAYMELLILQFNTGGFTEKEAEQVLSVRFSHAWPTLQRKFIFSDGVYINTRLQEEIEKRTKFIESRRLSGLTPKKRKAYAKHTHKRGENENRNEDEYKNVVEIYHSLCPKMNQVKVINDFREGLINTRMSEYGLEKVTEVIRKAGESDFLNGKNDKAWKADFEWIMRPQNFVKIMEGKYDNIIKTPLVADNISYKELVDRFNKGETAIWDRYEPVTPGDKRTLWKLKKEN